MTKPEERKWFNKKQESIEKFIPNYLQNYVQPYHGDFCFSRIFHHQLIAQLCFEGFLPIATDGCLLPKLHEQRCVITLPDDLHVSKSTRKKSKKFNLSVNKAFDRVVEGCRKQHGDRCWLYPPLVRSFRKMNQQGNVQAEVYEDGGKQKMGRTSPVRLYSIELWDLDGELVAGELGYTTGSIYTSLTGFSAQGSAGSIQLVALGRLLSGLGFSIWDLGMEMQYKFDLGCKLMPRRRYLEHVWNVRESKAGLVLPTDGESFNARTIIDKMPLKSFGTEQSTNFLKENSAKHESSRDAKGYLPEKKRSKTSNDHLRPS